MGSLGIKLRRVRTFQSDRVPGKFNTGDLHAEAQAEIRHVVFARVLSGQHFTFHAAFTKAAGHQNAVHLCQVHRGAVTFDVLGIHADNFDGTIVSAAGVGDCLIDAFVGVLQMDVLANHANPNAVRRLDDAFNDGLPFAHVGRLGLEAQLLANEFIHLFALKHQWHLVNGMLHIDLLNHAVDRHITEEGNLLAHILVDGFLRTADKNVRLDANLAQLGNGLLSGLGLQLAGRPDVGHVGDVHKNGIAAPAFEGKFPNGLKER